jgi:hypothetical protein
MRKLEKHEEQLDPVKASSIDEEKARQLYRKSLRVQFKIIIIYLPAFRSGFASVSSKRQSKMELVIFCFGNM